LAHLVADDDWLPEAYAQPDPEYYRQYCSMPIHLSGGCLEEVSEVKNVAYQAKTSQMDDYLTLAEHKDINFNLYVRGPGASVPTTLSAQLQQQIDDGNMNLFYIPGTE
jgi:Restriction endonuclease fold toxin 7